MLARIYVFVIVIVNCYTYRSNAPLIRNVCRGGQHFEGPHWSVAENALYWVDISKQMVYRLDADTNNITSRQIGYGPTTLVVTVKDYPKLVLITSRTEVYFLAWDSLPGDLSLRLLSAVDVGLPDNRCNDGKVDAKGRLWFGTMGKETDRIEPDQGTLYFLDENNYPHPEAKVRPVSISNGIAWTSDNKYMFYIDTPTSNIDVFDFGLETASLRNRRTIFNLKSNNVTGHPDGMTIDTDGNLWVACFNGGKVIKIDSRSGKLLEQHKIPAEQVTSVMWGGRDLGTLYVTTSRRGLTAADMAQQPEAGSLFAIEGTGSYGFPENQFIFPDADNF